jgi:hypothetical protein
MRVSLLDDFAVTRFLAESVANAELSPGVPIGKRLWSLDDSNAADIDPVEIMFAVPNVDVVARKSGHRGHLWDLCRVRADMQWRTEGQGDAKGEETDATALYCPSQWALPFSIFLVPSSVGLHTR